MVSVVVLLAGVALVVQSRRPTRISGAVVDNSSRLGVAPAVLTQPAFRLAMHRPTIEAADSVVDLPAILVVAAEGASIVVATVEELVVVVVVAMLRQPIHGVANARFHILAVAGLAAFLRDRSRLPVLRNANLKPRAVPLPAWPLQPCSWTRFLPRCPP